MINVLQFVISLAATAFLSYVILKNVKGGVFLNLANMFSLFAVADIFVPSMIGAVSGSYHSLAHFSAIDSMTYFMATVIFAVCVFLFALGWKAKDRFSIKLPYTFTERSEYRVSEKAVLIIFFAAFSVTVLHLVDEFIACGSWEVFYSFKIEREYLVTLNNNSLISKIITALSEFNNPIMLICISVGIVNAPTLKYKKFWNFVAPAIALVVALLSLYRGSILSWFLAIMVSLQIKSQEKGGSKKKFVYTVIALGALAVVAFVSFGVARTLLQSAHFGNENNVFNAMVTTITQTIGATFTGLSRCLNYIWGGNPLFFGSTIAEMFLFFIPRAIWAAKPTHYGIVNITVAMGSPDTTMDSVSIPGELMVNFGIFGLLLVPIIGYIFRLLEDLCRSPRYKYLSSVIISYFVMTSMWMSFTGFFSRVKFLPIYVVAIMLMIRKNKKNGECADKGTASAK